MATCVYCVAFEGGQHRKSVSLVTLKVLEQLADRSRQAMCLKQLPPLETLLLQLLPPSFSIPFAGHPLQRRMPCISAEYIDKERTHSSERNSILMITISHVLRTLTAGRLYEEERHQRVSLASNHSSSYQQNLLSYLSGAAVEFLRNAFDSRYPAAVRSFHVPSSSSEK